MQAIHQDASRYAADAEAYLVAGREMAAMGSFVECLRYAWVGEPHIERAEQVLRELGYKGPADHASLRDVHVAVIERIRRADPERFQRFVRLLNEGQTLMARDEPNEALEQYNEVVRVLGVGGMAPEFAQLLMLARADVYWRCEEDEACFEELAKAASAVPENAQPLVVEAAYCLDLGEPERALQTVDRALALSVVHPEAMWVRATALTMLGSGEAEHAWRRAIVMNPLRARLWEGRLEEAMLRGDVALQLVCLGALEELVPEQAGQWQARAAALRE